MGQAVPESDLPGAEVPASDLPGGVDEKKYGGAMNAAGTFLANAINSATLGLPDYLNKTFTPSLYAEGEKYKEANPIAATAGDVAGYVVPTGAGAVKGAQLGSKIATRAAERFAPAIPDLAKFYGKTQGGITGATMGAQTAAAIPGIIQGDPAMAVAAPEAVNQFANQAPMINHLGGLTGHIVPGLAGGAAALTQDAYLKMKMQYEAAKRVLGIQ